MAGTLDMPGFINNVEGIVTEKWTLSKGWADEALTAIDTLLGQLAAVGNEWESPTIDDVKWTEIDSSIDYSFFQQPSPMPEIIVNIDTEVAPFTQTALEIPVIPDIDQFNKSAPAITIPNPPDATLPAAPTDKPTIIYPNIPNEYPIELPSVPEIHDFAIPEVPEYTIPAWDINSPNISLVEPVLSFNYSESPYISELKDVTVAKLINLVVNGGTGLGADVEDALWQRALDRMTVSNEKTYRENEQYFAARGHVLPPGALSGKMQEALREITRAEEQLNYEITIEQARLAFDMTKFGLSTAVGYEQALMDFSNKISQRLYEIQKTIVEAGVQIFNAKIAYYNLFLERYKTEATVYKIRVDAVVASLEGYRAQLQGLQLITEIDKNRIEVYKGQLAGCQTLIDLFRSRLEAARIAEEIEKLKIEIFRAEVEVYIAQVNSKTATFNMYQAQISGEKAKVEVYSEQVKSYGQIVQAKKNYYDVQVAKLDAQVKKYTADVAAYSAGIDAFKAQVMAETARIEGLARVYSADADIYKSIVTLATSKTDAQIKEYLGKIEQMKGQTEVDLKKIQLTIENARAKADKTLEALKTSASVEAQVAAGSMSALSAQAHLQASAGMTNNFSETENHDYQEK